MALGKGEIFQNALAQLQSCHKKGETDEFIKPSILANYKGMVKNDSVILFNFRTDRPRQLTQALIEKNFNGFKRKIIGVNLTAMTQYYKPMPAKVAFTNITLNNLLGETLSRHGLKQLRISETEKYAHVTFFFNGQKEKANPGEKRILIKSPRVATYDEKPEMSAPLISARLVKEIKKQQYDFIVVNLVNGDMVGHTGKISAIKQAIAAVDQAQGEIIKTALAASYTCLVLADHGNAEDKSASVATSHTTNPVPVMLISSDKKLKKVKIKTGAGLKDVAPTILKIMGLPIPKEMDGHCFIQD
jgi:2,3-bisphosphoglycerate-independent phosphoglycerate mutase